MKKLRTVYILAWLLLIMLLTGTAQAAPTCVLPVDYNCDTYISFADVAILIGRLDATLPVDLWAYDLNRDGVINMLDAQLVAGEVGQTDVPPPLWCAP